MRRSKALNVGLSVLALFAILAIGCASGDEEEDVFPSGGDNVSGDDDEASNPAVLDAEPLDEDVPYLVQNGLPVPTHRYEDGTIAFSLDGVWRFSMDPHVEGEDKGWYEPDYDRSGWRDIAVPGSWNALIDEYRETEGVGWYAVTFNVGTAIDDEALARLTIRVGACFLRTRVWLNGVLLGGHAGGYTPIHLDAGDAILREGNVLVVRADNRIRWNTVPTDTYFKPGTHGWWPFGGITRSVTVHVRPSAWVFKIEPRFVSAAGGVSVLLGVFASEADYSHRVAWTLTDPAGGELAGEVDLRILGPGVHFFRFGIATGEAFVWSRARPFNQYHLRIDTEAGDAATVRFGHRTFAVRGEIFELNGKRDFWRGINRHSDHPETGPVETDETIARDVQVMGELGVNHTRPGHYPVDERLLDALADAGITILEETPVYQWQFGQMSNPVLLEEATTQLAEVIERDKNNPAILAWSLGNEYGSFWPTSATLTAAMREQARRFDSSRPTVAVLTYSPCVVPLDFTMPHADIIGLNEYYGWYTGDVSQVSRCIDVFRRMAPDKPLVMSEFGAGAVAGTHLPDGEEPGPEPLDDHSYTEEFQAWFHDQHLSQMIARDDLSGVMPWVLGDFRMEWDPGTGDPHPVPKTNLKGLLTQDRATYKASFETVRGYYAQWADAGF